MRVLLILVAQLAISIFVAATVMPLVLMNVPAAREHPRLGIGLMAGVAVVSFVVLALAWPRKRP